jgi:hypothetical protein
MVMVTAMITVMVVLMIWVMVMLMISVMAMVHRPGHVHGHGNVDGRVRGPGFSESRNYPGAIPGAASRKEVTRGRQKSNTRLTGRKETG